MILVCKMTLIFDMGKLCISENILGDSQEIFFLENEYASRERNPFLIKEIILQ